MFRTLAIAILWKNSQIFWNNWSKFHIALLIPFFPVKKLSKTDRIRGFWVMAILSIFWNFMTRRSQEFMDYLPLICNKSLLFYFTLLLPCSLTCSYNRIFFKMMTSWKYNSLTCSYNRIFFKMMTSWKYNAIYIINFSTHFNFPMCYYDSEKWFYVCRKLALVWDNFRTFAVLVRQKSLSNQMFIKIKIFIKKYTIFENSLHMKDFMKLS